MNSKWTNEKEVLEKLILNDKLSYEEIGRRYNCSGANIKKVAKKLGIVISQRRKISSTETFNRGVAKKVNSKVNTKSSKPLKEVKYCINCGAILTNHATKYCCLECQGQYKHKQAYSRYLEEPSAIMRANYSPRNFKAEILKEQGDKCAICGMSPSWNGKDLVFILDHIDGHASNNKRNNIRLICPNCDSQLDTYKSKNKNGERSYCRYRYKKE